MYVRSFVQRALSDSACVPEKPVVCFVGGEYSPLFFVLLRQRLLAASADRDLRVLALREHSFANVLAPLSMSCLGAASWYWITDVHTLDARTRAKWQKFVASYVGPHVLLYGADQAPTSKNVMSVSLPSEIGQQEYLQLFGLLYPDRIRVAASFAQTIFKRAPRLSLDQACLFMHYNTVVGNALPLFVEQLMPQLVSTDQSLFDLSQTLFAKNSSRFLAQWVSVRHKYAEPFWFAYWSEQFWRAYCVRRALVGNDVAQAKTLARRLPFSFMQRDWRKTTAAALLAAHDRLYQVDFQFKNGCSAVGLDCALLTFLNS